jgi:hypothetical protein
MEIPTLTGRSWKRHARKVFSTKEAKPAKVTRMDEFYIGQRVQRIGKNRVGVITGFLDLSYCIRPGSEVRARPYALHVKYEGKRDREWANGKYWVPVA